MADYHTPDGKFKPPASLPELPAALAKLQHEIARLRAVTANDASTRTGTVLQAQIARAKPELEAAHKELERKRAQARAALIDISEVKGAHDTHARCHADLRALLDELRQRELIEQAKADLATIREALQ